MVSRYPSGMPPPGKSATDRFLSAWRAAGDAWGKLTLGGPNGADPTLRGLTARPIVLRGAPRIQLVFRHDKRDITHNRSPAEAFGEVEALVGTTFRTAHLFTPDVTLQLDTKIDRLSEGPPSSTGSTTKDVNRVKQRVTGLDTRWLEALGVTRPDGQPREGMGGKLKQIHRFVEILSHLLADVPRGGPLRLVDLGCGKGYLTFAAYEWLTGAGWPEATVHGIELRPALVDTCNRVAAETGFRGLSFSAGAIGEAPLASADVIVALHACDTATDDALAAGIAAGAQLLVVAPCCHREVRPQLRTPEVLAPLAAHGILAEREAELVTDALRAALLESAGYRTKVFEFVSTDHTAKNLMISATRGEPRPPDAARALAGFWGIRDQRLASKLGISLE